MAAPGVAVKHTPKVPLQCHHEGHHHHHHRRRWRGQEERTLKELANDDAEALRHETGHDAHGEEHEEAPRVHRLVGHEVDDQTVRRREQDLERQVGHRLGQVVRLQAIPAKSMDGIFFRYSIPLCPCSFRSFTGFYLVLPSFSKFYWVLPSLSKFY